MLSTIFYGKLPKIELLSKKTALPSQGKAFVYLLLPGQSLPVPIIYSRDMSYNVIQIVLSPKKVPFKILSFTINCFLYRTRPRRDTKPAGKESNYIKSPIMGRLSGYQSY